MNRQSKLRGARRGGRPRRAGRGTPREPPPTPRGWRPNRLVPARPPARIPPRPDETGSGGTWMSGAWNLVLIGSAFVTGGCRGLLLHSPISRSLVASALCVAYILIGRRWVR